MQNANTINTWRQLSVCVSMGTYVCLCVCVNEKHANTHTHTGTVGLPCVRVCVSVCVYLCKCCHCSCSCCALSLSLSLCYYPCVRACVCVYICRSAALQTSACRDVIVRSVHRLFASASDLFSRARLARQHSALARRLPVPLLPAVLHKPLSVALPDVQCKSQVEAAQSSACCPALPCPVQISA